MRARPQTKASNLINVYWVGPLNFKRPFNLFLSLIITSERFISFVLSSNKSIIYVMCFKFKWRSRSLVVRTSPICSLCSRVSSIQYMIRWLWDVLSMNTNIFFIRAYLLRSVVVDPDKHSSSDLSGFFTIKFTS